MTLQLFQKGEIIGELQSQIKALQVGEVLCWEELISKLYFVSSGKDLVLTPPYRFCTFFRPWWKLSSTSIIWHRKLISIVLSSSLLGQSKLMRSQSSLRSPSQENDSSIGYFSTIGWLLPKPYLNGRQDADALRLDVSLLREQLQNLRADNDRDSAIAPKQILTLPAAVQTEASSDTLPETILQLPPYSCPHLSHFLACTWR